MAKQVKLPAEKAITKLKIRKVTSIGGKLARPTNKHKRRQFKRYRGQGRP